MDKEIEIEEEIKHKRLTAARVTPEDIDNAIKGIQYHVFPGTCCTVCCITLQNEFNTIGESGCVSPDNFDKDIGEKVAYANAREEIWKFKGYELKEVLYKRSIYG